MDSVPYAKDAMMTALSYLVASPNRTISVSHIYSPHVNKAHIAWEAKKNFQSTTISH